MSDAADTNRPADILPFDRLNFWSWHGLKSMFWWRRFFYCHPNQFEGVFPSRMLGAAAVFCSFNLPYFFIINSYTLVKAYLFRHPQIILRGFLLSLCLIAIFLVIEAIWRIFKRKKYNLYTATDVIMIIFTFGIVLLDFYNEFIISHDYEEAIFVNILLISFYSLLIGIISSYGGKFAVGVTLFSLLILYFVESMFSYSELYILTMTALLIFAVFFVFFSNKNRNIIFSIIVLIMLIVIDVIDTDGLTIGSIQASSLLIFYTFSHNRVYNYFLHLFLFMSVTGRNYRYHPAYWDDVFSIPYIGLHRLLTDYAAHDRADTEREIDRLIDLGPNLNEANKARAILLIRDTVSVTLTELHSILAKLPQGDKGWLGQTVQVKQHAREITDLAQSLEKLHNPLVRGQAIQNLITRIMAFQGTVSGFREPLASELRAASAAWLEKAQALREETQRAANEDKAVAQVFRAGDPVNRREEAFVPRLAVVDQLLEQAFLATGCPGIFLYGRRRTGKSSILKAFDGLLPPNLPSRAASLQDPLVAASFERFCAALGNIALDGAGLERRLGEKADLPELMKALGEANAALADNNKRLIIALDEYERLDGFAAEGRFPMDWFHALRESIQTHRHLVWLLAGSHHYESLAHVPWTSYLISMRQVDVTMFTDEETRQLLTDPLAHSPLFRGVAERPRLTDVFWGEGGTDWVQAEAGGWPHLVQLLAERAVETVNQRGGGRLLPEWRDVVIKRAVREGSPVLRELLLGVQENRNAAERAYVLGFASVEAQPEPTDAEARRHLLRRDIIDRSNPDGLWRLRVPLMQRWLVAERDFL